MSARLFALTRGDGGAVHLLADHSGEYPWVAMCGKTITTSGGSAMVWSSSATASLLDGTRSRLCRQCDRARRGLGVLRIVR